ncbi:MAG: TIGR00270 family protein [Asgard group archaeon]|nr:TIGR00270 family protein [Asgard group archaeon]
MATCEMCGQEIYARPIKIEIEGAVLEVCPSCAKHGKKVTQQKPTRTRTSAQPAIQRRTSPSRYSSSSSSKSVIARGENELVPDYHERIRLARQKMKLSQKDVSIQTKVSVSELQSIETGKMRPPDKIIEKLEKFFDIKITEEVKAYRPQDQKQGSAFQTLGDIVVIKKKNDED